MNSNAKELHDKCYEQNKIKIKQEITADNQQKYYYYYNDGYIPLIRGDVLIEFCFPMPVYIQRLDSQEDVAKSVSQFLYKTFQKGGIQIKLNKHTNIHDAVSHLQINMHEKTPHHLV
ncbi:MAG: hypothetical protein ABF649_20900 [Bacillus sp. (in: firmicutes)]